MKKWVLELLCCPACRGEIELQEETQKADEIESGYLQCLQCGNAYKIYNFIPRFVSSDHYVNSFSFEWKKFATTQYGEMSDRTFVEKTGLTSEDLKNKLILDAGCGSGRFCDVVSRKMGKVVGIDLSYSIDAAFEQIGLKENVSLVQGDLLNLPFKSDIYDIAFSIGVIHHTADPKAATKEIARVIKNSGIMAIWVYGNWKELAKKGRIPQTYTRLSYTVSDFYRKFTSRMPNETLFNMIRKLSLFYHLKQQKKLQILNLMFPSSASPNYDMWLLETFDWYSPKYQSKHTFAQMTDWFREFGFTDIERLGFPVSVKGRRET